MNKAQLIEAIASEAKLTKADANKALKAFINATTKAMSKKRTQSSEWQRDQDRCQEGC